MIGCGLMGREFAVAAARWPALLSLHVKPELVAICDLNEKLFDWYESNFKSVRTASKEYKELLADDDIDMIYCSVPHNLHEQMYVDIVKAGKHLLGEKPFGIDLSANQKIMEVIDEQPDVFVRCSSEFPFYPGAHEIHKMIRENPWGRIIEVNAGFLHSSDLNFDKKINWKRKVVMNGEYGCMGDLGMHALHIPIRAGWLPGKVNAVLSNIVTERYNSEGQTVPCETWDNATIYSEVEHPSGGYSFPMNIKTYRIAPGETNTWYIEILGTKFSARYSTKHPKILQTMHYQNGGKQEWRSEDLGSQSLYASITGGIFEFGFADAMLQMWAAFFDEMKHPDKEMPFGCVTPAETTFQHRILTAALESGKTGKTIYPEFGIKLKN